MSVQDSDTRAWLARTGQRWKAVLAYLLLAAWGFQFARYVADINRSRDPDLRLFFVFLVLGIAGLAWLAAAIRCPICRCRVGWYWMRHAPVSVWMTALHRSEHCPCCGSRDSAGPAKG